MLYRQLGSSDLTVSVVSLGALNFGNPKRIPELADSARVVHEALAVGINYIDTADAYGGGQSEVHVGQALRGRRHEVIVASKFKLSERETGDRRQGETVRDRIMRSVERSLTKLETDHLDLYQIHHPEPDLPHEEILEPLDELVRSGKVRYVGECNYSAWRHAQSNAVSERNGWAPMVSSQGYYNVMRRHVELEVLPYCTANQVAFIPYRPLAGGWLSGRFPPGAEVPASKGRRFKQYHDDPAAHDVLARLTAFAEARGHTILELAIAWLLAHPAIPTVIAGAMSPEQIRLNAAAADWQMSLEERDEIDAIAAWDGTGDEVEEPGMHTMERPRR